MKKIRKIIIKERKELIIVCSYSDGLSVTLLLLDRLAVNNDEPMMRV